MDRIRRIDELFAGWKKKLADGRSRLPETALDLFIENPFWTIHKVAERLNVAFTTAQRAIDRLESAGIIAQVGEARRNRVYCAESVLNVLEEPTPLPT